MTLAFEQNAGRSAVALVTCIVLLVMLSGCSEPDTIETAYGTRQAGTARCSVNGLDVLAELFEDAGHEVKNWRRLSPNIHEYKTIVWAPDEFDAPTDEQLTFLNHWLQGGRTLVFIGRDYDASITYWRHILPLAPPEQRMEISRRLAEAQAKLASRRARLPDGKSTPWFVIRRGSTRQRVTQLEGPWSEGIEAARTNIELHGQFDTMTDAERHALFVELKKQEQTELFREIPPISTELPLQEVLLSSQGEPLIVRSVRGGLRRGQVFAVSNGSFLLNLPLVDHEHRKLAAKLIGRCPPGPVAILHGGPSTLAVYEEEPMARYPDDRWPSPLGTIVNHLYVLGIIFCFAIFPIFGRPHVEKRASQSDFSKHIGALGDLLERSRDNSYAREQLTHYQLHVRRDSGVSHSEGAGGPESDPNITPT